MLAGHGAVSKRLQSELMALMTAGDAGVSAFPEGDSLFFWVGSIEGAAGTVYAGMRFKMSLRFPAVRPPPPRPPLLRTIRLQMNASVACDLFCRGLLLGVLHWHNPGVLHWYHPGIIPASFITDPPRLRLQTSKFDAISHKFKSGNAFRDICSRFGEHASAFATAAGWAARAAGGSARSLTERIKDLRVLLCRTTPSRRRSSASSRPASTLMSTLQVRQDVRVNNQIRLMNLAVAIKPPPRW